MITSTTILEPTYHLSPDEYENFSPPKVKTIAKDILVGELDGKVDETSVSRTGQTLATSLRV